MKSLLLQLNTMGLKWVITSKANKNPVKAFFLSTPLAFLTENLDPGWLCKHFTEGKVIRVPTGVPSYTEKHDLFHCLYVRVKAVIINVSNQFNFISVVG